MSTKAEDSDAPLSRIAIPPEAIQEVREWLDLKMRTGRYSLGLAAELAVHMLARCYHVHTIYDEIGILEGADTRPSQTRPAEAFKKDPLIGLWHKHHFQSYFLVKNLRRELERTSIFESAIKNYIGLETEDFIGSLVHDLTIGTYVKCSDRHELTGEWIVYEKNSDGSNYYLALGSHVNGAGKSHYRALRDKVEKYKLMDREIGLLAR